MENKLNRIKCGITGGIISVVSVLLFELFLVLKYLPYYNNLMTNVYGVVGFTTMSVVKIMFFSAVLGFLICGFLTWLFAVIYNKLLDIKVK